MIAISLKSLLFPQLLTNFYAMGSSEMYEVHCEDLRIKTVKNCRKSSDFSVLIFDFFQSCFDFCTQSFSQAHL